LPEEIMLNIKEFITQRFTEVHRMDKGIMKMEKSPDGTGLFLIGGVIP
jgi:hypothetical protein